MTMLVYATSALGMLKSLLNAGELSSFHSEMYCNGPGTSTIRTTTTTTSTSSLVLQDLVEKVIMLRKAVERERRHFTANTSQILSDKLR